MDHAKEKETTLQPIENVVTNYTEHLLRGLSSNAVRNSVGAALSSEPNIIFGRSTIIESIVATSIIPGIYLRLIVF